MSSPRFLLDEHITHEIAHGLRQREPRIRVCMLGQLGAPDPELLSWIEDQDCLLITNNRSTMPVHLHEHLAAGRHVPGILSVPKRIALGPLVDELYLIWAASLPGEYQDRIVYLPLRY